MDRASLVRRVRALTRDFSASIFRTVDIYDFINEGIDRIKSRITQLKNMAHMDSDSETPTYLPSEYHYLLSIYSSARCFSQDERHYQSSTLMNEFEVKLEELYNNINEGLITILDPDGNTVDTTNPGEYVKQVYFNDSRGYDDFDNGVDGVS